MSSPISFFLSTDLAAPELPVAVGAVSREFSYARTPIVVLAKSQHSLVAEQLEAATHVGQIAADAGGGELTGKLEELRAATGQTPLDEESALATALEAASTWA